MKIFKILSIVLFSLTTFLSCVNTNKKQQTSPQQKVNWTLKTYAVNNGWGYYIFRNGKKLINQDQIPAILGKHPFPSEQSAKKTAELVVKKLNAHQNPSVTKDELIALGIINPALSPIKTKKNERK